MDRKPTAIAEVKIPRGRLIKLKRKKSVRLSFEVDVELVPKNGDLNIRVVACESPKIVPASARG